MLSQRLTAFFMATQDQIQHRKQLAVSSIDRQTFKQIERYSKEVCQNLAARYGDKFQQTEVTYGLAAFLTAVHIAVKNGRPRKSETRK